MYEIKITKTARNQLKKLDKNISKKIIMKLKIINKDPYSYVEKLVGFDLYKIRVGDYRVILSIENQIMTIFVLYVDHRSKIYKKLK